MSFTVQPKIGKHSGDLGLVSNRYFSYHILPEFDEEMFNQGVIAVKYTLYNNFTFVESSHDAQFLIEKLEAILSSDVTYMSVDANNMSNEFLQDLTAFCIHCKERTNTVVTKDEDGDEDEEELGTKIYSMYILKGNLDLMMQRSDFSSSILRSVEITSEGELVSDAESLINEIYPEEPSAGLDAVIATLEFLK